jgi:hypothetical protein
MEKSTTSINQCFYSLLESKDIQGAVTERSPPFSPSASSICCTYKLRTGCQSWHNFVKTIKHPWCSEISEIATGILRKCTTKVSPRLEPPSQLCRSKLLLHRLVLCPIFPSVPKKPAELGDRQLEHWFMNLPYCNTFYRFLQIQKVRKFETVCISEQSLASQRLLLPLMIVSCCGRRGAFAFLRVVRLSDQSCASFKS